MLIPETSLLDYLPGLIGWKDANRHYLGANKALLTIKGFSEAEEIVGKTDEEITPWLVEDNLMYQQQDLHVLKGEKISMAHIDVKTNEIFLLQKYPLTDHSTNVTGLIYQCHPAHKSEVISMLKQLDTQLNINANHYTLNNHQNKYQLTHRECECVFLLIRGKSAKEIGAILALSKRTVESYVENIKNKMNCKNKAEILVEAVLSGYHTYLPASLNQATIIKSF